MAYTNKDLKLERLLIYSDIYGLGLTSQDVTHLKTVYTTYKDSTMLYIYRAATPGYDLALFLNQGGGADPYINLLTHDHVMDTVGYPVLKVGNIFLKFSPNIADLPFLSTAGNFIPCGPSSSNLIFNNLDEIKNQITTKEIFSYSPDYYHPFTNDVMSMLYTCVGKTSPNTKILKKDYEEVPAYIYHIIDVLTLPNDVRLAFYVSKNLRTNYYSTGFELAVKHYLTHVGEPAYNWTDPDRYFSHIDGQPKVFYVDPNPILPREKEIIDNYRRGQNVLTLDNTTIDTLIKRWTRKQQDIANEAAAVKTLEKKIKDKIEELNSGGEFAYNDVTFRKNEFEYEGQIISCKSIEMSNILKYFAGAYSEDHLNFDRILDTWIDTFYRNTGSNATTSARIGDVDITLEHIAKKTARNVTNHTYRINNRRINKDEVVQVIGRAICFPDTPTFDEFCDTVAGCSLRYHKYLAGGINVNAHDEIFGQTMEFKISLERQKNKNYIVFNNKHFKIGDTNKLLSILHARGMSKIIDILLDEDVAGMSGDDIKQLMTLGRQALLDQRKKEEELLKDTMSMFGIETIVDFSAQNGKLLNGYLVKGGLRDYIVEKEKLLVYEYPSGRYICMVDKGQNEHTNTARLVNRFFALSNDSKLAKEINTL